MPFILHEARNLISRLVADERADKIQRRVKASSDTAAGNDAEAPQLELRSTSIALAAGIALLERDTSLSGIAGAASGIWTTANVGVVVFLSEVEAKIVDDVALFHDVGAFTEVTLSGRLAEILETDYGVWMGGCAQAGEDARLGEEQGAGADGDEGTLAAGVFLLDVGVGLDEAEGLELVLEDDVDVAARDDEHVELREALVGFFEGDVGVEGNALGGGDGLLVRGKGALECSALWRRIDCQ